MDGHKANKDGFETFDVWAETDSIEIWSIWGKIFNFSVPKGINYAICTRLCERLEIEAQQYCVMC